MALDCPRCGKAIDVSGERPSYCPFCGVTLSGEQRPAERTTTYVPADPNQTAASGGDNQVEDIPDSLGGFRLIRLLGAGGMGSVFEGVNPDSKQRVAVKLLNTPVATSPAALERFRQEGRLASQIAHPNCVFVLRADEEAGRPFIVMELMTGVTLRELVKQRGPLPPAEAVAKILDVIDGLIEAHRLNILHRDVKPSNCFLMRDGRVKVGDFGLSKSLHADVNLTQSGSFLGTVLYAAPEQLRGESLDLSADVYAVAATLYYLLTGRAPFENDNPTAVIARVLSESPPDVGLVRPELPRRLAKVVMRGLERAPDKRWQSLEDLRASLAEFAGTNQRMARLAPRVVAFIIDLVALMPLWLATSFVEALTETAAPLALIVTVAYFVALEGWFGRTAGKWLLRLRVVPEMSGDAMTMRHAATRAGIFFGMTAGLGLLVEFVAERFGRESPDSAALLAFLADLLGAGLLLWFARTPGAAWQDRWSRTRVMQLDWPRTARRLVPLTLEAPPLRPLSDFPELPTNFGEFEPRGVLEENGDRYRLFVTEPKLGRDAVVWVYHKSEQLVSERRRSVARPTRGRWLTGGTTDDWHWDAFLRGPNTTLADVVRPGRPLGWPETQGILDQVATELVLSRDDAPMIGPLSADRILLRPDGRVQLTDRLPGEDGPSEQRDLAFLASIARLALEGHLPTGGEERNPVRAVIPLHAAALVERLCHEPGGFASVSQFRNDLDAQQGRPAETTSQLRVVQLGSQALLVAPVLALFFLVSAILNGAHVAGLQLRRAEVAAGRQFFRSHNPPAEGWTPPVDPAQRARAVALLDGALGRIDRETKRVRPGLNVAERAVAKLGELTLAGRDDSQEPDAIAVHFAEFAAKNAAISGPEPSMPLVDSSIDFVRMRLPPTYAVFAAATLAVWAIWAFITRGGLALRLTGLALVRNDGTPAARWQCGLRPLLAWFPVLALLTACVAVKCAAPQYRLLHNLLWWAAAVFTAGAAVITFLRPERGPHDRIVGVNVVPR